MNFVTARYIETFSCLPFSCRAFRRRENGRRENRRRNLLLALAARNRVGMKRRIRGMNLSDGGIIVWSSGRFAQQFAQMLAIIAARSQLRAVLQDDDVIAVKPGLQLFDAFEVDDD